ncbi:UNVERIFIED_CONTAM: protein OSB1, mitochondrial [Sesamum angustifolium]|uniref:Protein OSB1, mitochondrial n=1 Tax=Sesamum angustifolium TaxID=2727405 RepID=A0AAW2J1E4_9LAMI
MEQPAKASQLSSRFSWGLPVSLARFKNAASESARLFSSSAALIRQPCTLFSDGERSVYRRALKFQRPTTVRYQDILPNSVSLIGRVVLPLKACKSPMSASTLCLTLRHPAALTPVLGSYRKVDANGKLMHNYEVVVTEINFVAQHGLGPVYQSLTNLEPAVSAEDIMQKRRNRLHLWHIFFANPYEWRDNRNCKLNPKAPDFRHKDTGEVLWLQNYDPPWIKKQLQLLDSRLSKQSQHRNAWSHLSPLVYSDT